MLNGLLLCKQKNGSVITQQDDMIICCDTRVYFYFYLFQNFHGGIQILPSSSTSASKRPSDDAKRETEPQRIKRFQGYLLQFMQWHDVKPYRVQGKPGDPGVLSEYF